MDWTTHCVPTDRGKRRPNAWLILALFVGYTHRDRIVLTKKCNQCCDAGPTLKQSWVDVFVFVVYMV